MKTVKLKDLVDFSNGYAFKSTDYVEYSNTVNCRMSNIRPDGSFDVEYNIKYLPDEFAEKYKGFILNDGDIIIAMTDMAGDPKILGVPTLVNTKGYSVLMNQRVGKLTLKSKDIHPTYLKYYLMSNYARNYFKSFAGGGVQLNIGQKEILNIDIKLCDIKEQVEICNVLDKINVLIQQNSKQIEKLDQLIKSRFIELFGLPVSNSKKWNTEKMNDVAPAVNYSGDFEETVWLLNLDMVEAQTGRIIEYRYVYENEVGNSTCTFDTSNILYSKLRPYLNKVVIPDRCGYATSEMIPLKPNTSKLERTYLAFMLRSDEFVNMINEKVAGAKMPRVSMSDFREFDVPVPPMELQKQFSDFVDQPDKSKLAVQQSLEKLEILKKSLMQKYFG